jgi:hypothetical protein
MDPKRPEAIQVQALQACAPYYAPKLCPISSPVLSTTIDLPPLCDVGAALKAQQIVTEAMSRGTLELNAGQSLMTSLSLMTKSQEVASVASTKHTFTIIGGVPDLPLEETDPASIGHNPSEPALEEGPAQGATQKSPVYSQQTPDRFGASPRHQQD